MKQKFTTKNNIGKIRKNNKKNATIVFRTIKDCIVHFLLKMNLWKINQN